MTFKLYTHHKNHWGTYIIIALWILFLIPEVTFAGNHTIGSPLQGAKGVHEIMQEIMQRNIILKSNGLKPKNSRHAPRVKRSAFRFVKKQNPFSPHIASFPHNAS